MERGLGQSLCPPEELEEGFSHLRLAELREKENPADWRSVALASWAQSTLEIYTTHVKAMATTQFTSGTSDPKVVLRLYLFNMAQRHTTASGMRQVISACRLLEELDLCAPFVPKNVWRLVRGKERMAGHGRSQRWGSLEVLETMGRRAQSPHERMVVALALLSTAYCLRVNEAPSIRAIDLQQSASTIRFYDQKSRRQWVTRPSGDCSNRIFGFVRLQVRIQGRSPYLLIVAGGARALSATMAKILVGTEYHGITWHAWRRAGATMFLGASGTMPELLHWGRWKSLRVARKYIAGRDGVPWTKGQLSWPVVVPGSVGDWRYEWKEFGARRLWPSRHFIRDTHLEWVPDDSGAEEVHEKSGTTDIRFDMEVPGQGVKRKAPAEQTGAQDNRSKVRGTDGVPVQWKVMSSGGNQGGDQPMEQKFNVGVTRPRSRHQPVRAKRPAVVEVSKDVARLASLAAKARKTAGSAGAQLWV